ncbi:MAG: hypothetical protein RLZZ15_1264, partial [Verrucomicrobiota bacterium]
MKTIMLRAILFLSALVAFGGEPPVDKVAAFVAQVEAACRTKAYGTLNSLYGTVRVSDIILDEEMETWDSLLHQGAFDSAEFVPIEKALAKAPNIGHALRQMVGPKFMNGSSYSPSVPVTGILFVYMKPKGTGMSAMHPVGVEPS